ncbi:MAG: signal peptidase I [Clostridiales bacterium]|nr:signal peptidase I [Clostridiales bacterium]
MIFSFATRACNIAFTIFLALLLIGTAGWLGMKRLGFKPMAVLSTSMAPSHSIGDLVIINSKASPFLTEVGDVVAYAKGSLIITQRVVSVDQESGILWTRGDSREHDDPYPVPYGEMLGKASLRIPKLGEFLLAVTESGGYSVGIIIAAFLMLLRVIPKLFEPEPEGAV